MPYLLVLVDNLIFFIKVDGNPLKNYLEDRWEMLVDKLQRCLNKLTEVACLRRRNYILDQVKKQEIVSFQQIMFEILRICVRLHKAVSMESGLKLLLPFLIFLNFSPIIISVLNNLFEIMKISILK